MTSVSSRRLLGQVRVDGGARRIGHNQFPTIPKSVAWRTVVDALGGSASVDEVVALSATAIERQLRDAPHDPVYREAVRLLVRLPLAARDPSFASALGDLSLPVGVSPNLTDIVFAIGDRLDEVAAVHRRKDDFGELTRRALTSAVSSCIGGELPGLLEPEPKDVEQAVRRFSNPREFTRLARAFYTRLFAETLSSYLDRVLAAHIGQGRRFADVGARSRFDEELGKYSAETTRIIHEFSAGWYGKRAAAGGDLTADAIAGYGAVALKKILAELRRKEPALG